MSSMKRGIMEKDLSEGDLAPRLLNCEYGRKGSRQSGFPRQRFLGSSPTFRYIKLAEHVNT